MENPFDLPQNISTHLAKTGSEAYQETMSQGARIGQIANGVLAGAMARNFDELGTRESRAHSGLIATPVASPSTQQGT